MLDISVSFLGGEFVAQTPAAGSEWPPHPARLVYALIAAWFEGGCDAREGEALRWLESRVPAVIAAPQEAPEEAYATWVPMNSVPNWDRSRGIRPKLPKAQKERFSRHVGDEPVSFVWEDDVPPKYESALEDLCRRCTRLGSAESLVAMTAGRRAAFHGPGFRHAGSGTPLRVPVPGLLDFIAGAQTLMPGRALPCDWKAYRWGTSRRAGRMTTIAIVRGSWPVERAPELAHRLRRALVDAAGAEGLDLHPLLHGLAEDGLPLQRSHLHFCPLPHVGFPHAMGAVLGVSFILPVDSDDGDRAYLERVVAAWLAQGGTLAIGRFSPLAFGPADSRQTLSEQRWCRASTAWQTVVPMELPRHVLRRRGWDRDTWARVRAAVDLACSHGDLPAPLEVEASHTPFALGSPHTRTVTGPHRRPLVHVRLHFADRLEGPLVLGAGRHLGLGLMEPIAGLT